MYMVGWLARTLGRASLFSQVVLKDEGVGVGLVGEQIRIIATATKTAPPPFLILLQSG